MFERAGPRACMCSARRQRSEEAWYDKVSRSEAKRLHLARAFIASPEARIVRSTWKWAPCSKAPRTCVRPWVFGEMFQCQVPACPTVSVFVLWHVSRAFRCRNSASNDVERSGPGATQPAERLGRQFGAGKGPTTGRPSTKWINKPGESEAAYDLLDPNS